jgi:hypothetical protein
MTGWRTVHAVMDAARVDGPHVSPKGLRHRFCVGAIVAGIPLNIVQEITQTRPTLDHLHLCRCRRRSEAGYLTHDPAGCGVEGRCGDPKRPRTSRNDSPFLHYVRH